MNTLTTDIDALPIPAIRVPFARREALLTSGSAWIDVDGTLIKGQPSDDTFAVILSGSYDRATSRANAQANAAALAIDDATLRTVDEARAEYSKFHALTNVMASAAYSRRNHAPHADAHDDAMCAYFST